MSDDKPRSWCKPPFAMVPIEWLKLDGRELRVAAAISSFASRSGEAFPSYAKLSALTRIHERDLRRIIFSLREHGIFRIESEPGKPNHYFLSDQEIDPEVPF
jgi:hypothetical protein